MQTILARLAASAALSLALLPSAALTPALAIDDDVDFVCYDVIDAQGNEDLECQTVEDFAAECALVDPDHVSDECGMLDGETAVIGGIMRTRPAPLVPRSLVESNEEERAGGARGGGLIILRR